MRENEQKVLEYLNGLRVKYGIGEPLPELPPDYTGYDKVSYHCPVAVMLERCCGYGAIVLHDGDTVVDIEFPDFVTQFQRDHDSRSSRSRRSPYARS